MNIAAMMKFDVFLSYFRDDRAVADAACAALESFGLRCWIAPRDIIPGIEWKASIIDAINNCRVMVLIFSARANESAQIRDEVARAVAKAVPIIPVWTEYIEPTKSLEVHLNQLAASIAALLKTDSKPAPPHVPPTYVADPS